MNRREALKNSGLLAGISLSTVGLGSLLQACQQTPRVDWQPLFFTADEAPVLSAIVDTLLPATDTPGALELKVDMFVDTMLKRVLSPDDQAHVRKGFEKFQAITQELFGKPFTELASSERGEVLKRVGTETNRFNPSIWGSTLGVQPPIDFYRRVRQYALVGYFTSEKIGTEHLIYDPVPGEQIGCIDWPEGKNSWTL